MSEIEPILEPIVLTPIGIVHSSRSDIKDDHWDAEKVWIELAEEFGPETLKGLDSFSHVAVLFYMHKVTRINTGARRPRNRQDWPEVGIFAQRGKNRPNQMGLTVCEVLKVEGKGLYLKGLDAVHGTPVLDLKPWVHSMGPRGETVEPHWMQELMQNYWS